MIPNKKIKTNAFFIKIIVFFRAKLHYFSLFLGNYKIRKVNVFFCCSPFLSCYGLYILAAKPPPGAMDILIFL